MSTLHRIAVPASRWLGGRIAALRRARHRRHGTFIQQPHVTPNTPRGRVECVPDPHGRLRLLLVRGDLTASLRQELASCFDSIPAGSAVHLDVSAAHLPSSVAVFDLTAMIDELEDRRVSVRVVGLDPRLPATECHTPSS